MKNLKHFLASFVVAVITLFAVLIFFVMILNDDSPDGLYILMVFSMIALPILSAVSVFKQFPTETTPTGQPFLVSSTGKLQLVGGLFDLPQGSICKAKYNRNRIVFSASGQEFTLESSKMIDVSIMNPTEIQKQYVSSIGGALAGAVLLGPLGAILGGSASQKTLRNKRKYLIFTYLACDEETKYIVFDVTTNPAVGSRIKSTYRFLKKNETRKIEL